MTDCYDGGRLSWRRSGKSKVCWKLTRPCGGQRGVTLCVTPPAWRAERGVSFVPFRSLPDATAARLVVHRLNRYAPAAAQPFLLEVWRKLFAEGADIGSSEVLACCLDPHLPRMKLERALRRSPRARRCRAPPISIGEFSWRLGRRAPLSI
jgi:hypothetical protein